MADDLPPDPSYLRQWRNALADDMRVQAEKSQYELWGDFARQAPLALMALRPGTAAGSMRPFNPKAPPEPLPKRPEASGDNGLAQHVYEAMLGRTRGAGQSVGEPGSGWWMVGGQPIPKPTNILPWLASGGVGYGIWKGLGGPEAWQGLRDVFTPGTPEYERSQAQKAGSRALLDAWRAERETAVQTGAATPKRILDFLGAGLTPEEEAEMAKRRLPGGVGREPY